MNLTHVLHSNDESSNKCKIVIFLYCMTIKYLLNYGNYTDYISAMKEVILNFSFNWNYT